MDLTSIATVKSLLQKHNIRPSKRLGQNFLVDKAVLKNVVEAAELHKNDVVLEVGAGFGTLTVELAKRAKKVIAVEKDEALVTILKECAQQFGNVDIVNKDILNLPEYQIPDTKYSLIGNIPYYLTSALIRKFLEIDNPPKMTVLMVQKEVAQRICAKPPDMSLLAVSVQFYAKPKIVSYVPRSSFWPMPEVDSAILKITEIKTEEKAAKDKFFNVARAGFSSPRKQLLNNLSRGLNMSRDEAKKLLEQAGIDPARRAETLRVEDWYELASTFYPHYLDPSIML